VPPFSELIAGSKNGGNLLVRHLLRARGIQNGKPVRIGLAGRGLDAHVAPVTFWNLHDIYDLLVPVAEYEMLVK
jgi:hypothetical protein